MSIKADLRVVRAYVEKGWTQGAYAKDITGSPVRAGDPAAICWCFAGALQIAQIKPATEAFIKATFPLFALFNDEPLRTKAEMLAKVDELLALAPG